MKKKKVKSRISIDEVYVDEKDDVSLALKKLYTLFEQINPQEERLVLVIKTELKYPEKENA